MNPPSNFSELVGVFIGLIARILPVLSALAFLVFIWGLVKFIRNAGDEKAVKDGKKLMVWGLIALFVMVSFLSIISFFYTDIGLGNGSVGIPYLPTN